MGSLLCRPQGDFTSSILHPTALLREPFGRGTLIQASFRGRFLPQSCIYWKAPQLLSVTQIILPGGGSSIEVTISGMYVSPSFVYGDVSQSPLVRFNWVHYCTSLFSGQCPYGDKSLAPQPLPVDWLLDQSPVEPTHQCLARSTSLHRALPKSRPCV